MKSANQKEIVAYIRQEKIRAKRNGKNELLLLSREIHDALEYQDRMPSVCGAMYKCMESGDIVVHTTPSGKSSTIKIKCFLD